MRLVRKQFTKKEDKKKYFKQVAGSAGIGGLSSVTSYLYNHSKDSENLGGTKEKLKFLGKKLPKKFIKGALISGAVTIGVKELIKKLDRLEKDRKNKLAREKRRNTQKICD